MQQCVIGFDHLLFLQALDPLNKPTFWPHTPEEQLDYDDSKAPQDAAHH
jgi:hypothetical protein